MENSVTDVVEGWFRNPVLRAVEKNITFGMRASILVPNLHQTLKDK